MSTSPYVLRLIRLDLSKRRRGSERFGAVTGRPFAHSRSTLAMHAVPLETTTPVMGARLESAPSIIGQVELRLAQWSTCKLFECGFLATGGS
jgi:hypothetical protein